MIGAGLRGAEDDFGLTFTGTKPLTYERDGFGI